ncbi:MFS transporter [Micromonospora thermarum]|uniref:MFS transporter n=1 Tax=Micromonospora thermarum TaxID=2720024 RepID=A0ABX0Z295_9ACTN|nr:MFS transporter [Micromonospora thermarum]NJP31907.1 MFS transporter [Micromonospora thermarum]
MTTNLATVPAGRQVGGHHAHGRRIVAALAITTTIGYGTLYYGYPVLLRPIATTLDASATAVTGALTASVLAGALMAVPVGRWLDHHGGRALMTTGSVTATILLIAWSQVQTVWQLYAVMIGIGITGAMVLYEPAFAVIVTWFTPERCATALLAVTIVAGIASTIFMPLTGFLDAHLGWRGTLLVLAATYGVVAVPLHVLTIRKPPAPPAALSAPERQGNTQRKSVALAVLAMPGLAGTPIGAIVTVTGFGLGFGIASLATPALLADRYGTTAHATIAGRLAACVTIAKATAPLVAATVLAHEGYDTLLGVIASACLLAAVGMLIKRGSRTPTPPAGAQSRPGCSVAVVAAGGAE